MVALESMVNEIHPNPRHPTNYCAHLEQWLAGWLRFDRICIIESMQIPGILLITVLGKSYGSLGTVARRMAKI
jgi:hypothetical protein